MYTGKNSRAKETNWNTLLRKLLELHVYLARLSAATVALDGRRALAFSHYSHAPSPNYYILSNISICFIVTFRLMCFC